MEGMIGTIVMGIDRRVVQNLFHWIGLGAVFSILEFQVWRRGLISSLLYVC